MVIGVVGINTLSKLFVGNRVVGVLGNPNTAKSSLVLSSLLELKTEYPKTKVFVFGVESCLKNYLESKGIDFLYSMEDILDLKLRNSVIYVDEVADFFSTSSRDKQTDRFKRFVNRIVHNNCWFVLSTAEVGYFNKFACSLINCFLVKEIEIDSLVNNTWVKRLVKGLPRSSEYRVELGKSEYYVLDFNSLTKKCSFDYNINLDSKSSNVNPFIVKEIVKDNVINFMIPFVKEGDKKSDGL
jgi:hypothetical protein